MQPSQKTVQDNNIESTSSKSLQKKHHFFIKYLFLAALSVPFCKLICSAESLEFEGIIYTGETPDFACKFSPLVLSWVSLKSN